MTKQISNRAKKIIFSAVSLLGFALAINNAVFARGMMGNAATISDGHVAREEAEGKVVWEKLQTKELTCEDLSDDNFGTLGEYFMGQMMGDAHEAMNNMMIQMMGEKGEEQTHAVMGKRLSGCDASAAFPPQSIGFIPMTQMMMGRWSSSFGNGLTSNTMNFGFGPFSWFGWLFMILWWVLIIAGVVALIKWLTGQSYGARNNKKSARPAGESALEILKERYAKGEIGKKEFEEKKKDLV